MFVYGYGKKAARTLDIECVQNISTLSCNLTKANINRSSTVDDEGS